jgi:hypothetical protein
VDDASKSISSQRPVSSLDISTSGIDVPPDVIAKTAVRH